jgi:hypothetical protein
MVAGCGIVCALKGIFDLLEKNDPMAPGACTLRVSSLVKGGPRLHREEEEQCK